MSYILKDKRELAKNIILQKILPALKVRDLDYKKVEDYICSETGCISKEVEIIIGELVLQKKIKEIRILTIPDSEINSFVKELRDLENEKKLAEERLQKIEKRFAQ